MGVLGGVRLKPSSSIAAQSQTFSIDSPLKWRTIICAWMACAQICAAISGGAGEQTTPAFWSPPLIG